MVFFMSEKKIIVGIYIRVSTQEQASDGYSIGEQKERLEKYAEAHGWVVYKVYSDPGYSGGSTDRPALRQMIRDTEYGKLDKVIVYKLDRLSRSQKDTLYLIEDVFLRNHVDFVSMTENFDTGSPLGRAMIGILSVFAQLEREQIKERMQIGLDARAKEGYYHGGPYAPIGYEYQNGELIINDYEAMQVRKIYELFLDGMPIHSIHKYIESRYQTKYGTWQNSGVRSCLSSVVYSGRIQWKGNVYEGRHEAIINPDTFDKVQEELKRRSEKYADKKHPFQRTSMLGGLLWCGNCGARYFVKQNTSKRPGITPAQRYYTCYSRGKTTKSMIKDPSCKNKSWNVKDLDKVILDEIRKLAVNPDYFEETLNTGNEPDYLRNKSALLSRIEEIEKQQNRLLDLYQVGGIEFGKLNERIEKLSSEKENIEAELDGLAAPEPKMSIIDAASVLQSFPESIENTDPEELKKIVHSLIDGVVINGEDVEIHWTFV